METPELKPEVHAEPVLPVPSSGQRSSWFQLLWLLPVLALIIIFGHYPRLWQKASGEFWQLDFNPVSILKMAVLFYGLFILPGWMFLNFRARGPWRSSLWSASRILVAALLGLSAQTIALFAQKFLSLPYLPVVVLACLVAGYALVLLLASFLPLRVLLLRDDPEEKPSLWESLFADLLLTIAIFIGLELALRGRASSVSLMGDGYPHLIYYLGTLVDGPMPDANVFYSTFILNITPMGFHTIWASIKTLAPDLMHMDFIRYFSVVMVPLFVACMMAFFSFLAGNRLAGAMLTLSSVFISGGGLSLNVPIVFFPWYWSLGWCLAAGVFFLLLKNQFRSGPLSFFAGWVMSVGFLIHAFFAVRMSIIIGLFLLFELLRRALTRDALWLFVKNILLFGVGTLVPFGLWMIPLVLRHGWEPTYSYDYLIQNYSQIAPDGIRYIRRFMETRYELSSLWFWSRDNAGLVPVLFAPLGIVLCFKRWRESRSALLIAWLLGMASAVLIRYVPNPYRYFEFLFFVLAALAAVGLGFLFTRIRQPAKTIIMVAAALVLSWSLWGDYYPKYRKTINLYGRVKVNPQDESRQEKRAEHYLKSKSAGQLDRDYGGFTGHLWLRQKKVWEIYLQHQQK